MEKDHFKDRSPEAQNFDQIGVGDTVLICEKHMQKTASKKEHLTKGVVLRKLTSKKFHPRGIKVMLETGEVGRVIYLLEKAPDYNKIRYEEIEQRINKNSEKKEETVEERLERLQKTYFEKD